MNNLSTSELSSLAIIFGILIITYFVLRSILFPTLKKIAKRTSTFIDDLFLEKKISESTFICSSNYSFYLFDLIS